MSGLAQFVASRGLGTLQEWCEEGYHAVSNIDEELSGEGCGVSRPNLLRYFIATFVLVRDVHPLRLGGTSVTC